MSERAVFYMKMRMQMAGGGRPSPAADIESARKQVEESIVQLVSMTRSEYRVDIAEEKIAGIRTRVFTPKGKPMDPDRVLINLHGGAFALCADGCAVLESTPIAALSGYKVISVDYRMAPEAKHPAAIEDLAAVYREVLKTYQPKRIGIYGCSAGGALRLRCCQIRRWRFRIYLRVRRRFVSTPGAIQGRSDLGIFRRC
jgi:acetyl esterase/lipase